MIPQTPTLSPEEKQDLFQQAQRLQQANEICELETYSEHSLVVGRILEVRPSGITFEQAGTGKQTITVWSNVAQFNRLSQSIGQNQQQQSFAAAGYGQQGGPRSY